MCRQFLTPATQMHGSLSDVTRLGRNPYNWQSQQCTASANRRSSALECPGGTAKFMQNKMLNSMVALATTLR